MAAIPANMQNRASPKYKSMECSATLTGQVPRFSCELKCILGPTVKANGSQSKEVRYHPIILFETLKEDTH
jgi:hypothetical protein